MSHVLKLTEKANGTTVSAQVHETLELALDEKRMSGYRWDLSISTPAVRCVREDLASAEVVGGAATHRWLFEAVASGTCDIELAHRRPWEKSVQADTFRFRVRVAPKS